MTGYSVERHGYATASGMVGDIITDMISNGFDLKFQTSGDAAINKATLGDVYRVILEASGTVDPLNASAVSEKQPWRICFDVQAAQTAFVYVATPLQLPDTGVVSVVTKIKSQAGDQGTNRLLAPYDVVGAIGAEISPTASLPSTQSGSAKTIEAQLSALAIYSAPSYVAAPGTVGGQPDSALNDETTKGLVTRARRVTTLGASFPMSYRLSITPRGVWLGIWEEATTAEASTTFNWLLVQRPVDRATGQVLTTGKAPVMCVNCVGNQYWQFTVREQDILRPGKRRQADLDAEDSECIINTTNQVSLSEDGKYIVTFPSRLNTSRYRYPHELDMIGTTSADVVSQYTDVPLTVYGESAPRVYKALHANGPSNTGMRLLILQQGGGIS